MFNGPGLPSAWGQNVLPVDPPLEVPPGGERPIGTANEFVLNLLQEDLHTLRLDGRKGHSVTSRSTIVLFGQRIRLA